MGSSKWKRWSRRDAGGVSLITERRVLNPAEHPDDLLLSDLKHKRLTAGLHRGDLVVGQGERGADQQAKSNRKSHRVLRGLQWFNYPLDCGRV